MDHCTISFPHSTWPPLTLPLNAELSRHLTAANSPILFGCRTGLCGTCLVRVQGDLPPPGLEEAELLAILAPGDGQARLACQLQAVTDLAIVLYGV